MAGHRPSARRVIPIETTSVRTDAQGNSFEMRPMSCPTCRGSSVVVLGYRGGKHQRYGLGIETRIVQCRLCGLIFPDPFPFPVEPQRLYGDPDKYFATHDENEKLANCRQLLRKAARRLGRPRFDFVDVGSGRGELLRAGQAEECRGLGLEFSRAMIDQARRRHGLEVQEKSIDQLARERPGHFDVVFLIAVLEHVYDPDAMIAAAATLCRPGGLLYVDVPNPPPLRDRQRLEPDPGPRGRLQPVSYLASVSRLRVQPARDLEAPRQAWIRAARGQGLRRSPHSLRRGVERPASLLDRQPDQPGREPDRDRQQHVSVGREAR